MMYGGTAPPRRPWLAHLSSLLKNGWLNPEKPWIYQQLPVPVPFFQQAATALSRLNFRVEPLQLDSCFVDRELPIHGSLLFVDAGRPHGDLRLQRREVADPSVRKALAGYAERA